MNNSQRELRRAAAKAFMESLGQLEKSLKTTEETTKSSSIPTLDHDLHAGGTWLEAADSEPDLRQVWDDAAADIDQFIQAQNLES